MTTKVIVFDLIKILLCNWRWGGAAATVRLGKFDGKFL